MLHDTQVHITTKGDVNIFPLRKLLKLNRIIQYILPFYDRQPCARNRRDHNPAKSIPTVMFD